jgi:L-aspartate oxidase
LDEIVRKSVSQLGENLKKMEFVYSQTHFVPELLNELGIKFEERSFGIIPIIQRGGATILRYIQQNMSQIFTETELVDFYATVSGFDIFLRKRDKITKIKSKYLVLATGGYAGTFDNTDNVRYKNYNVFNLVRKNRGIIINEDCVFLHPFGYSGGTRILIGRESKIGEFVDETGNYVFNEKTRQMIKNDNYHEIFDQLLEQTNKCREDGHIVYFVNSRRKEEIAPCIHYTSGGIKTDYFGRVDGIPNLFAIGECQANGSRNNGRFPGYPFTSSIVYGNVLGEYFLKLLYNENKIFSSINLFNKRFI